MAFSSLGRVVLGLPSPSPRVCTDGQTYTDIRAKTSCMDDMMIDRFYGISLPMVLRRSAMSLLVAQSCCLTTLPYPTQSLLSYMSHDGFMQQMEEQVIEKRPTKG